MSRTVYVGIDGGGSSTECCLAGLDGTLLGIGLGGATNIHFTDRETALCSLRDAVQGAGLLPDDEVAWAYLGMAGAVPGAKNSSFVDLIRLVIPQVRHVTVVSDAEIALAGALELRPGICVNAGTGAFGIGKDDQGRIAFTNGWGPLLGDEGSGYWIGLRGLIAALRNHDLRGRQTTLLENLMSALGVSSPIEAALLVYEQTDQRKLLSSLCQIVLECAGEGDAVALEIVREAGVELALAARAVALQLDLLGHSVEVAPLGSILIKGELIGRSFAAALTEMMPQARIVSAQHTPAVGSLLLAMQSAGQPPGPEEIARLAVIPGLS